MIINGTHIQGVFKYDNSLEFEKGDFVIYDDIIYICTAGSPTNVDTQTVKGKVPTSSSDNFTIYLGDKVASVTEYRSSIASNTGIDKYVSSKILDGILSSYMTGIDQDGVINSTVIFKDGTYYLRNDNGTQIPYDYPGSENILDYLISRPDLNSALLKLDQSLPNLRDEYFGGTSGTYLLRQMTYVDTNGSRVRIQCLVSPQVGKMWWRQVSYSGTMTPATGIPFRSTFYDSNVKNQLDHLHQYYQIKLAEVEDLKKSLKSCWRYETIFSNKISFIAYLECFENPNGGPSNILIPGIPEGSFSYNNSIFSQVNSDNLIIQTIIRRPIGGGWRSYSVALDLREVIITLPTKDENGNNVQTFTYNIDDGVSIILTIPDPETLSDQEKGSRIVLQLSPGDCVISNMYIKRYYE